MVRRAAESRLRMYTSFCFSTAPTITARPRGSVATYWPGTMRLTPDCGKRAVGGGGSGGAASGGGGRRRRGGGKGPAAVMSGVARAG